MEIFEKGKLRDLGMVFKPSFKCLKNKKINLSPAFLKLETLLFQNMFLLFHLILYSQSDFDNQNRSFFLNKKWFDKFVVSMGLIILYSKISSSSIPSVLSIEKLGHKLVD